MAQFGPVLTRSEVDALFKFLRLVLAVGDAGREPETLAQRPVDRWAEYGVEAAVRRLPRSVVPLFARHGWHRMSDQIEPAAAITDVTDALRFHGHALTESQLQLLLIAGAYWVEPNEHSGFGDDKALAAIEELNGLVNGYAQSLPLRRVPGEEPDAANRNFRAYQRRRYGYDTTVRSPQALVRRLPTAAQELIDTYADRLVYGSPEAAFTFAATVAVALGRPLDETIARQLDLTFATSIMWRGMNRFPDDNHVHPLIGARTPDNEHEWDAVAPVIAEALEFLAGPDVDSSDPSLVHTPSRAPVASVELDAKSLAALHRLDDYVNAFAAWLRHGAGSTVAPSERIAAFDRAWRGEGRARATSGPRVLASLPPGAVKVVACFDALIARGRRGDEVALDLARALGDESWAPRMRRTLNVAAAWLNGELSKLETQQSGTDVMPSDHHEQSNEHDAELELFRSARQRDAEALLDFGAAIAEIVRLGRSVGANEKTPPGWWTKFHSDELTGASSPAELLDRLPEGSHELLALHAKLLESEHLGDLSATPRALASALDRMGEELCVRTLAVALSVGAIWSSIELPEGSPSDTLLGVDPERPWERYVCGRAQAQLEWGLQELFRTDTVIGV